ncbi:hypothetical protein L1049_020432 [Liquidambar formosana]|uniref:Uncharacterized protein n=1 Tax=Liquidambar formosana TaxID=63359 RepID=A0AAP0SDZ0_LIQFO
MVPDSKVISYRTGNQIKSWKLGHLGASLSSSQKPKQTFASRDHPNEHESSGTWFKADLQCQWTDFYPEGCVFRILLFAKVSTLVCAEQGLLHQFHLQRAIVAGKAMTADPMAEPCYPECIA